MVDRYTNVEHVPLNALIPPGYLRTVPRELLNVHSGLSEKSIVIELSQDFAAKLHVKVPRFGRMNGYVRMNDMLRELDGYNPETREFGNQIRGLGLYEASKAFILTVEFRNGEERVFSVSKPEVRQLLNTCLLAPEHKLS